MNSNHVRLESALGEALSAREVACYSRQLILPEVGMQGQRRLKGARVLIIGTGGLGAPTAMYLAAAGVGTLGLVDFDTVAQSNLHRQVLFNFADIGRPKIEVAAERIEAQNPLVKVERHALALSCENALALISQYDLVLDATDNFQTRYLINDACVALRKPCVSASIYRFEGQVSVYWAGQGPCYRCLYPDAPPVGLVPSCAEGGVMGVLPGILGTLQANEAIKLILGVGKPLIGRVLRLDALTMKVDEYEIEADAHCAACSHHGQPFGTHEYQSACSLASPSAALVEDAELEISTRELQTMRNTGKAFYLLDVRNPAEFDINRIEGAHLIPVDDLENRLAELPLDLPIVCYCLAGKRSLRAAQLLHAKGFSAVASLSGGINAWGREVDPSLVLY